MNCPKGMDVETWCTVKNKQKPTIITVLACQQMSAVDSVMVLQNDQFL